jgi:hypothetical protein
MFKSSVPSISVSISRCASSAPSTSHVAFLSDARLHSALDQVLSRSSRVIQSDIVARTSIARREAAVAAASRVVMEADADFAARNRPMYLGDGPSASTDRTVPEPYGACGESTFSDLSHARWRGEMAAGAASLKALRGARGTRSSRGFSTAAAAHGFVSQSTNIGSCRHVATPWGIVSGRAARGAVLPNELACDAGVEGVSDEASVRELVDARQFLSYSEFISNSKRPARGGKET